MVGPDGVEGDQQEVPGGDGRAPRAAPGQSESSAEQQAHGAPLHQPLLGSAAGHRSPSTSLGGTLAPARSGYKRVTAGPGRRHSPPRIAPPRLAFATCREGYETGQLRRRSAIPEPGCCDERARAPDSARPSRPSSFTSSTSATARSPRGRGALSSACRPAGTAPPSSASTTSTSSAPSSRGAATSTPPTRAARSRRSGRRASGPDGASSRRAGGRRGSAGSARWGRALRAGPPR